MPPGVYFMHNILNVPPTSQPRSEELVSLMRANANFQLRHGNAEEATAMLEELRKYVKLLN